MGAKLSSKPDGGLTAALQLDQAAIDLVQGSAAGGENGGDREAAQLGLFSGGSVFGEIRMPDGEKIPRTGPGRPRGSTNRTTRDLVKLIERTGKNPLLAMAEIVSMPIDVIASTLGCTRLEAAEYHRKVMSDLAPYVAQKLPTAVQIQGANAGMLVINLGMAGGDGAGAGLAMRVIDGQANPLISLDDGDGDDAASHDAPSHDEAK